MKEVSKEKFKKVYFEHGMERDGWDSECWENTFESPNNLDMKYKVKFSVSEDENRMMIISDYNQREYRLFFLTEESEESMFFQSGKGN